MSYHASDRAQATPLWAIVLLLAALLMIPAAKLIGGTVERAEAQNAADAAALAAAVVGPGPAAHAEARAVAAANGAQLIDYAEVGNEVEVTVRKGDFQASARAERTYIRTYGR